MKLTLDAKSKRYKDENGFLHVAVSNISKETVNPYYGYEVPKFEALGLDAKTIYQVYRKGDELKASAPTFVNLPLMRDHHEDSADSPQREHRVGSLGSDVVFSSPYLQCSLCVTDGEAIRKIESGKRMELSAAYRYEPVLQSGTFDGMPYDIVMTEIRANHVALVEEGRAGPDVVVADEQIKGDTMSKKILAKALESATANLRKIKKVIGDSANADLAEATEQAEADVAKAGLALQRIEAEEEGEDPKDLGINADEDGVCDEDMKKHAQDVGLDVESPEVQKAFAEGVKYGEKLMRNDAERDKVDKEHESEGEKKAMDEDTPPPKATADAAIIRRDITEGLRATAKAVEDVKPLVGALDAFAFDSASGVYLKACQIMGVAATAASARDVVTALKNAEVKGTGLSFDSALGAQSSPFSSRFAHKE